MPETSNADASLRRLKMENTGQSGASVWVARAVRYYRSLGFFQNRMDYGTLNSMNWPDMGWKRDLNAPRLPLVWDMQRRLPAFGLMADEEIAGLILADDSSRKTIEAYVESKYAEEFEITNSIGTAFRQTRGDVELAVVKADLFRVIFAGRDYGEPLRESDYVDVVQALSRISRGTFAPAEISVRRELGEEDATTAHIFFTTRGRMYEIPVRELSEWMNDEVIVRGVNELLARSDSPYRFYYCFTNSETFALVVLTPDEKAQLQRDRGWTFMKTPWGEAGAAQESNLIDKGPASSS
jgi:hypothetical protein